jgi:hypothetical protein
LEATVKNLGIAIAVSEYTGELAKLPACTRDGSAIARVLQTESRFDDVLVIDSETISTSVKHSLISFFKKHEQQEIGDTSFSIFQDTSLLATNSITSYQIIIAGEENRPLLRTQSWIA